MDRKRLTVRYDSLVHLSCEDGYITAAGLQAEGLFLRDKTDLDIDQEPLPLLGFETSVFRIEAPASSSAAKTQELDSSRENKQLFSENFSNLNTAPQLTYGKPFLLVHAVSQMHVAVFPSRPSGIDPDCVKLVLAPPGEVEPRFCEFVMTSRYKIHDDGDPVCRGDEVLLRLAAYPIFVHVTASALKAKKAADASAPGQTSPGENSCSNFSVFDRNVLPSDPSDAPQLEVNGSEERSVVFVLQRYDIGRDQADRQRALHQVARPCVPAGKPVVLYHRELKSLLTTSLTQPTRQERQRQQEQLEETEKFLGADVAGGGGGGGLPMRRRYSSSEGIARSRCATQAKGDGASAPVARNAGDGNEDDDRDRAEEADEDAAPFPLLLKDDAPTAPALNGGTALDDARDSCTVLWVFENEDPTVGGPVRMESVRYRLRQACSNLYLAVAGSGVDAFFEDNANNDFAEPVDPIEAASLEGRSDASRSSAQNSPRAISLCMIPPPRTQKDLERTLFTITPMFASECGFLIEDECLVLQNVLTGMYVCTEEAQGRPCLQWQPSVHDTITARSTCSDIEQKIIFLSSHCERLCRYRDVFQAMASLRPSRHASCFQGGGDAGSYVMQFTSSDSLEQSSKRTSAAFVQDDEVYTGFTSLRPRRRDGGKEAPYRSILPIIRVCQSTLEELIRFCSVSRIRDALRLDGIPIPRCQRMMFDMTIHRLVMDVLLAPFALLRSTEAEGAGGQRVAGMRQWGCSPRLPALPLTGGVVWLDEILEEAHADVHRVCRLALRLLRQMVRKASTLKMWLDEFVPYLLELDGRRFHVVDTLTELFSDNVNIPRPVVESVTDHFIGCLRRVRSAGYVDLFAAMCTIGFRGIAGRQAMVCQKLLVENGDLISRFVLNGEGEWAVVVNEGEPPVAYTAVFSPQQQQQQQQRRTDAKVASFLQSEIDLLGCLCFDGCPPVCCAEVGKVFPAEVLLRAVKTFVWTGAEVMGRPSPLDLLRGRVLRLALQCYIMPRIDDIAVQLRASTVLFGSSSLRLPENPQLPISGNLDDDLISAVKFASLSIIRANPHFVQSDVARSVLLRTSLNAWLRFTVAQQVSACEMCGLIPPLLSLLDGTKDVIDDSASKVAAHTLTRLEVSEASVQVMETREMICITLLQLLESVSNMAADDIIQFLDDAFVKGVRFPRSRISGFLGADGGPNAESQMKLKIWPEEEQSLLPAKDGEGGLLRRLRGGYHSLDAVGEPHEMGGGVSATEVVEQLKGMCKSIMWQFRVDKLVPLLMDLTRYDSPQLTAQATELLIRLCAVRRTVAQRVLQVHTLPSSEVVHSFDHLYTVAVHTLTLHRRGCFDDAVAFALASVEEPERPQTAVAAKEPQQQQQGEDEEDDDEEEEHLLDSADVSGEDASAEEAEAGAVRVGRTKSGKRHLWEKAAGAVRMLAYRNAVRRRRRSVGLSDTSQAPLRLVIRVEMVCHWGIHLTLLRMHPCIDPDSPAFFQWMRFFYLFTFSRDNARKLLGSIDLFMRSLTLNPVCTVMCLHIIVAIFASIADPTPYLSNVFLEECVKYIDSEVSARHSDDIFLSQLSSYVFANPAVGGVARRRIMQLLRDHNTLRCLPGPGVPAPPVGCGFIASMVELLCHICSSSTSALAMGQRALPMNNIFSIILAYGSHFSPLHSLHHNRDDVDRTKFQVVGTYLRALVSLYITADGEEGGQGKELRKLEWMGNSEWWAVVTMLMEQLQGLTDLIAENKGKVVNRGLRVIQRYRHVWLMSIPVTLLTFFADCFSEATFYHYQSSVGPILHAMCGTLMKFGVTLISSAGPLDLSVREAVNYRRLLGVLHMQTVGIVGLEPLAKELDTARNHIVHWLLQRERDYKAERQRQQHVVLERRARGNDVDEYSTTRDIFLAGEGMSRSIQYSLSDSFSRGLFLSGAAARRRDVERIRDALGAFVKNDVLIPVEDSLAPGEAASVANALLRRSTGLSGIRGFVWNALDGMRKRYFSPMALIGLLNLFYNALHTSLQPTEPQSPEAETSLGHDDAGYNLQLTFSELGVSHMVTALCNLDDDVLTYSAVRLGVMILEGGNQRAQFTLLKYLEAHPGGFCYNVRDLLQRSLWWVRRINLEQQLVILERGGVLFSASNTRSTSALFAAVLKSSSYRDYGGSSKHPTLGWDRVQGCMRLRLLQELFRMLQLFCEGHNLGMQNYIRSQHDNMHSVNLVYEVMLLVTELSKIVHYATVDVVRGGFELLTELCQGPCHANQEALLSYDVCVSICALLDLLSRREIIGAPPPQARMNATEVSGVAEKHSQDGAPTRDVRLTKTDVDCLRTSLTTCLLSLIEGCRSPEIFRCVLAQIPIDVIERQLSIARPELCDRILEDETFEDDPCVATLFNWLIFLNTIRPYAEGLYLRHIDEILRHTVKLKQRLGMIEIQREDGLLEQVFFRIPFICHGLSQSIKDDVLWGVNRTSRATKLGDFLHQTDNLIFEVERAHGFHRWVGRWTRFRLTNADTAAESEALPTEEAVRENRVRLYTLKRCWNQYLAPFIFSSQLSYYEYASVVLAVLINVELISVQGVMWSTATVRFLNSTITYLCVLQFLLSCAALCVDAVVFFPVLLYKEYRLKQHLWSGSAKTNATMQEVFAGLSAREVVYLFCARFTIQFHIFLVAMAALALFVSRYFAAAHLLLIIYKVPTLRTFINAITQNGKQLLLTAFLGVVVLYLFAIVGYLLFPQQFDSDDGANKNCVSLLRCFLFILWQGLRQGGGVGDIMQEEPWSSGTLFPRLSYDLVFFSLVNVVFLNIMFGLIIDTFGELRDAKREKEVDMQSTCFVCGLNADVFEKAHVGGLRAHVRQEHNMWMYLYFIHYLRRKDPSEFTGQESYVDAKLQRNELSFFPEEKCLTLEKDKKEQGGVGDAEKEAAGMDEEGGAAQPGRDGPPVAKDAGAAGGQQVALTLRELAGVKEALSRFLRELGEDAQKVKSMIQQLEITSRSVHGGASISGGGPHGSASAAGTLVSRGAASQISLRRRAQRSREKKSPTPQEEA
ncbi:inositol 1,4,5-trisphosphate receptor [Trypanosoma conorhini]|uniref:Inositol 1,4,5-trisphosphate receptor n=1 Tax=Trypanosoma conorhini TaxID=83891 RepID=A0A422P9J5_9TRYP|nr:inositol 1,4,5-trisphosphate receptor [Trypanosoma conorhini]RNF14387.1 inositol 1,4,5-trisphosphate receptor [Trypanosoma conorhini]